MSEEDYSNIYAIPANYTDSGKLLGGMLEPRNAVETVILLLVLGYPELVLIPMPETIRIVVLTITLLPMAVLGVMGIGGDSLFQYIGHIFRYLAGRRTLHYRRVGYHYDPKQLRRKGKRDRRRGRGDQGKAVEKELAGREGQEHGGTKRG